MSITDTIRYVGVNDHQIDLFEGQYAVPNGMAYNSYAILDEQTAVMDSVDIRFTEEWFRNISEALDGNAPDYLIVQHMEPDHSGSILRFMDRFPEAKIVATARAFTMMQNFFGTDFAGRSITVGENDTLSLGSRTLTFLMAPMIHWPEVMMTFDDKDQVFFTADAFGKFGALDVEEDWACEARRYYFGIVGKYGISVQSLLKKASALPIKTICPLHGPVLKDDLGYYLDLYNTWSSYGVEEEGIVIAYTSVYGHTKEAVETLAALLREKGCPKVVVNDLARSDMAECVEDAFRYGKLVLATTTYNGDVFPYMRQFIEALTERGFCKRTVAFMENGSWAPQAARIMKGLLEKSKELTYCNTVVRILSALSLESRNQLNALAEELMGEAQAAEEAPAGKKYICKICGYIYEGEEVPEDFKCPICKQGKAVFKELE